MRMQVDHLLEGAIDAFFGAPSPAEMMRMFIATLLAEGMEADEIEAMVKRNPAALLGV